MGIYKKGTEIGMEASKAGSQPYIDLMGRRVPLFRTQNSQWRALSNGTAVQPSTAFSYIAKQLRQTTPYVIGALRLLAQSFASQEINSQAWGLYAEFRPEVTGWGERGEVKCETILNLRREKTSTTVHPAGKVAAIIENSAGKPEDENPEPPQKKIRSLTLEEYEAALDQDSTFDSVDLDFRSDDKT